VVDEGNADGRPRKGSAAEAPLRAGGASTAHEAPARSVDAIVLAAGRGTRVASEVPKQYLPLGGRTVLARAIDAFLGHPDVRRVVVVIGEGDEAAFRAAVGPRAETVRTVIGGATRQASVRAALEALAGDPPARVLVHDGARPFASAALVARVAEALSRAAAVIPAVPVSDTLKRVAGERIEATVPREDLQAAQTPQGFHFAALLDAHRAARAVATDDAGVMEAAGHTVHVVEGEQANRKLTTAQDLDEVRRLFGGTLAVGMGFDVHRLVPGGPLVLGGLTVPHDSHLAGHSDADVALHALTDALFGAIGEGDIGHHFPPSDDRWRGAASDTFLRYAAGRAASAGEIAHLDLTIICERPRIGPHREAMRARIASICGLAPEAVSVKATTTERLGFTGRGEGIAAQAVATVRRD